MCETQTITETLLTYTLPPVLYMAGFFLWQRASSLAHPHPDNEQLFYPQTNESSDKLAVMLDWPKAPRKTRLH